MSVLATQSRPLCLQEGVGRGRASVHTGVWTATQYTQAWRQGVWLGARTEGWGGGCAATLEEGVRSRKCGEQSSHSAPG